MDNAIFWRQIYEYGFLEAHDTLKKTIGNFKGINCAYLSRKS
jgi:hypothetical protein